MKYRVVVTPRAKAEIDGYIAYIADERKEPDNAGRVLEAIWDAIPSLESMPNRCPKAPESESLQTVVRMLIVKRTLLVLFRVDEGTRTVTVHGLRHGSQPPLNLQSELE